MASESPSLSILTDFPPTTLQDWRSAAEKVLKGAPFEEKMETPLPEGITLHPIYSPELSSSIELSNDLYPGFGTLRRGATAEGSVKAGWNVAQELPITSASELNTLLRFEIQRGLGSIHLVLDPPGRPVNSEVPPDGGNSRGSIGSLQDFETALEGIELDRIPVMVHAGATALPLLALLAALATRRGLPFASIKGSVGSDPLGSLLQSGYLPVSTDLLYEDMKISVDWADSVMSGLNVIWVDGTGYHDGGANAAEELGFVLATGAEYLRELGKRSTSIGSAGKRFQFSFSVGPNFFLEIAKLRAARMLWSAVVSAFGGDLDARRMRIHARTSSFYATRYDPYVNMLRATTEGLAGVVGGCESLHISPFDDCFQLPDDFSRRIARNTQVVLQREVHADHVIDPAGGSWYVEWLTEAIAEQAWKIFQKMESLGGMTQAVLKGVPQQLVAESFEWRKKDLAQKRLRVVGVNVYQNREEDHTEAPPPPSASSLAPPSHAPEDHGRFSIVDRDVMGRGSLGVMDALIHAASTGATLSELGSGLRGTSGSPVKVPLIPSRRLVEAFEDQPVVSDAQRTDREVQR